MKKFSIFFIVLIFLVTTFAKAQVKVTEQDWVMPTYPVVAPEKNPVFFKHEVYQGASRYYYPYAINDEISLERTERPWKIVVLENEYIKLGIAPEIGGKLYFATDKSNDYNFIYKNNVVKPSNIGMLGAWVSGGIEWCVLHHHRASTFLPVDYSTTENSDGSKTIWIGETEPRHRMRWTIGITSFPGRSYYQAEVKIFNATPQTHSFLYWANVATHTNDNYQVIFPPSVNLATYHAKNSFTRWPFSTEVYNGEDFTKGVDISYWKNSPNNNSFFAHDLREDFMGGYDHGKQAGTIHIGDHNIVKGAKLWEWGSGPRGQATEGRLTEKDGPYVEIMTGAFSDNQPDYSWIQPYEVKTFKQYWYPVKDIQGFKNANLEGAVNLEAREKNQIFLGYYLTKKVSQAKVILKQKDKVVLEKTVEISPVKTFTTLLKINEPFDITDFYTEVKDVATGEVLVSYQPVKPVIAEKLPETVKRPAPPEEIKTTEELFLTGSRIEQFYNPTLNAHDYYNEALKRDPGDIRTNTAFGTFYLKNGDYVKARSYFSTAIKRVTKDYTRPATTEALYLQGLTLKALNLLPEAEDTLYRATWDYAYHSAAYLELAKISSIRKDFPKALHQVNESLNTNVLNSTALGLKASILRHLGQFEQALSLLSGRDQTDPLDFRAGNELYLSLKAAGKNTEAQLALETLTLKLRNFEPNYSELALAYLNDGFIEEAEDLFKRYKGSNPWVSYYLGYISDKKGDKTTAAKYFKEGSALPVDYVFPYRLESVSVLEKVIEYQPGDARPWYYLGNLLYDKQPAKAISHWEEAVKRDPSFAIAYRNLGWGYARHEANGLKAIAAYEKAISLKKDDPLYYDELDVLYEKSNAPIAKRLALFEGSNDIVSKRDDSFARQIAVLTLAGKADKAVEYLAGKEFNYREGSSGSRDVIINAHLVLGKKYLDEKDYRKALAEFIQAQVPEEEAGESRSGNRNIQVEYFIGLAYDKLGDKAKAKANFSKSAAHGLKNPSYLSYYQALSLQKLGRNKEAEVLLQAIISEGENQISKNASKEVDFFAKFGEKEAEQARLSNAYLLKGLGYKGLVDTKSATENLKKAAELSVSNLWANKELENI